MFYVYTEERDKNCAKVVALLTLMDLDFTIYIAKKHFKESALARIIPEGNTLTYPQIFDGFKYVGGMSKALEYIQKL